MAWNLVDARNRAEKNPKDADAQAAYAKLLAADDKKLHGALDKQLPMETYRAQVVKEMTPLLDGGAGVIAGCWNHFTHLYEVTEDHIRIQDPGQFRRADCKINWEEARALRYFWNYVVLK